MDTKWKNITEEGGPAEKTPGRRRTVLRAAAGFLAFFLGVSLLLEGLLFFGANLSSQSGRQWLRDSFRKDYQDTSQFRGYVSGRLETLIAMGVGSQQYSYPGYYYYDGVYYGSEWPGGLSAEDVHDWMKEDKNVLYQVTKDGQVKYTNAGGLTGQPEDLPDGYDFLLCFDGEKVTIWKDGGYLDVYGDPVYHYDSGVQWYVPGYDNFAVDEETGKVQVLMAVLQEPRVFIKNNFQEGDTQQYDWLYYLCQGLSDSRGSALSHLLCLGAGAVLLALYLLLRKDKARADRFLARGTGRVWFEGKLLLLLILAVCFLPRPWYLTDVWTELTYAYGYDSVAASSDAVLEMYDDYDAGYDGSYEAAYGDIGTAMTVLSDNGAWLLREYLVTLADHSGSLLILLWGVYLLWVNDWRYNRKPWRRGILGLLTARELKYPLQRRLSRWAGLIGVAFGVLALEAAYLFLAFCVNNGWPIPPWWYLLILGPCGAALLILIWTLNRQNGLWSDLGKLGDHISAIREGSLEQPLCLPQEDDLAQMADDLNHIQQGLHQAVEERTRSERMKVELVTNVSHDLKTPLTSIISYTELLAQEPLEPPASEYVEILKEKSQRLKSMVQDVFDVSKAASGQLHVELERLDYARLLRQTLADQAQAIQDSGLTLRPSIPDEAVFIMADSDRMYRVFQNLLGNALKYSLPGSRVYLTLSVERGEAVAVLQNTSAAELRPGTDYTGRFVRGDESRSDGGSGLGLSIADSFTQACGGRLEVSAQADLFTARVSFPLAG